VPLAEVSSARPSPVRRPSSVPLPSLPTASTAVKTDAKTDATAAEAQRSCAVGDTPCADGAARAS
jgi:hypothetical protein